MLADQLIDVLIEAGVERVYGVVGDSLNPLVDAIRRADGIEWVHVRNEEAGAFAAAAEAQLTGQLAVCAGSCGPGNTHLIQGLYDANRTGAPVLAIASQIPASRWARRSSRRRIPRGCSWTGASTARSSARPSRCRAWRAPPSSTRWAARRWPCSWSPATCCTAIPRTR